MIHSLVHTEVTLTSRNVVTGTGLAALDRIYADGASKPLEALGGSCGNVLISLAMLGHNVAPLLTLGDDSSGEFIFNEFQRAGCLTDLISIRSDYHSPIIAEYVDLERASHHFVFTCPDTLSRFPKWQPVDNGVLEAAHGWLKDTSIFYTDRLSVGIVEAMETAYSSGALIFFEPSGRFDQELLDRATAITSILKISDERRDGLVFHTREDLIIIRTHGADGLTVSLGSNETFFPAQPAYRLVDPCGSGDMVTVGLLNYLLRRSPSLKDLSLTDIFAGILAGQHLAALNCAFAGARGLFYAIGGDSVRRGLDAGLEESFISNAIQRGPCDGYTLR